MSNIGEIYNLILHSNLLNFTIFLAIIILICKKFDIPAIIENMRAKIIKRIEESDITLKEAAANKEKAMNEVKNTAAEVENINSAAEVKAKALEEQVSQDTLVKIENIKNNTQKIIDSEEKSVRAILISNTGTRSVEAAKDNIISELEKNKELHNKFIEDSINELDKAVLDGIS